MSEPTPSTPYALRIDHGGDPWPTSSATPRLAWIPSYGQRGAEIEAAFDGQRVSAVITGEQHHDVEWPWAPLRSGQRVRWRVRTIDESGWSAWSDWHVFEAGLHASDWTAHWISPVEVDPAPPAGQRPAYELVTRFSTGLPSRARLYATALGVYEAYLNGTRVGRSELTPGTTSYDSTLYAQAYDVTDLVRSGDNELVFVISDGWYRGQIGAHRVPARYGERIGVRAELHLAGGDGGRQVVRTGPSWRSRVSRITRASLMQGQASDLRLAPPAELPVLTGDVTAPAPTWSPAPPVRVVDTLPARSVTQVEPGVWVVDFGQNAAGWIALTDLGPAGARTVIDYGEFVGADGDLDTRHLDSVRPGEPTAVFSQRDEVISDGQGETFEPRHTVHGFQYARIRRDVDTPLAPSSVVMRVVHTDLERTGSFECSNADLNRLHQIAEWSFRGNAVDVPTDCPTRERLAWTGDYQVFCPTATRLFDVLGFTRKWLQSVRDDQLPDGRITNFAPDLRRLKSDADQQFAMMTGSAGWGDAIVAVPWELYRAYGRRSVLQENWEAMKRWVDWAAQTARTQRHPSRVQRSAEPAPHEQYLWDGSFHWGEWLEPLEKAPDGTRINPVQASPGAWFMADKGEVGTAYLYRSTATLAAVARVIGRDDDARHYAAQAERVRDAWATEYLGDDGRTVADTQASYVRALSFGLVPAYLRERSAARLAELIRAADTHLGTGFLSTADLLPVLCETGHADLAFEVLLRRTPPSWLFMLDQGATSIWEDWEGIDEDGMAHESLNHYSKGAVIRFLHTHILGLRQPAASAGWAECVIAPVPGAGLTWARGEHLTPNGPIHVEWSIDGDEFTLTAQVPTLTRAVVVMPDGETLPVVGTRFEGRCAAPRRA